MREHCGFESHALRHEFRLSSHADKFVLGAGAVPKLNSKSCVQHGRSVGRIARWKRPDARPCRRETPLARPPEPTRSLPAERLERPVGVEHFNAGAGHRVDVEERLMSVYGAGHGVGSRGDNHEVRRNQDGRPARFAGAAPGCASGLSVSARASSIRSAPSCWSAASRCGKGCGSCGPSCRASWRRAPMRSRPAWCASSKTCQQIGAAWGCAHRGPLRRD